MDEYLLELVEGKRVAVVGPSPHLINQNKGKLIDDYDVVVRVNYFQTPVENKKDYGSRTDIMFHNFGTSHIPALQKLIDCYPEDFDNIKMIGCPLIYGTRGKEDNFMSWSDDHIGDVVHNAKIINKNNVPFYWIGVSKYKQLYKKFGCEAYSGSLVISILLSFPIKELFITGMTFYKNAKTPNDLYFDGYKTKEYPDTMPGHGEDAFEKSFKYFLKIYKENMDVISVDDVLDKIIKDSV